MRDWRACNGNMCDYLNLVLLVFRESADGKRGQGESESENQNRRSGPRTAHIWYVLVVGAVVLAYVCGTSFVLYCQLLHQLSWFAIQDIETVEGLLYFTPAGRDPSGRCRRGRHVCDSISGCGSEKIDGIAAMDKRKFLKTSGALIAGSMFSDLTAEETGAPRKNWAGNYQFKSERLDTPKSVEEVQKILKNCQKAKALGARHSFNSIADSPGDQVSLADFKEMKLDPKSRTLTIGAGVRYGDLAPHIDKAGYALHNLASLPHISVAGACSTGTHGSGNKNGNLSTAVAALEFVTADGKLVTLSRERDGDRFRGAVVGLGGLGVITRMTLDVLPRFDMRQIVYQNLPIGQLEHHLDEIFGSGYSVSFFTDWQNHEMTQVWVKSRVEAGSSAEPKRDFYGAKPATRKLHPITGYPAENCTEQMGIPGPWYERLPHFRMNFTPSSGDELQSEYFVPREKGYEAILAVERLKDHITPHLFVSELRTIAADDLWMSQCYQRQAMTIHFTWKPQWAAVKNILPMIEGQLAPFGARPHWAKVFTMQRSRLQPLYPRLHDFRELLKQYDPGGKFRNEYLNTNIYA